jgi:hypothetical protein
LPMEESPCTLFLTISGSSNSILSNRVIKRISFVGNRFAYAFKKKKKGEF